MEAKHWVAAACVFLGVSQAHAWELRQVTIKQVQVEAGSGYITIASSTTSASGCATYNGWLRISLSDPGAKEIMAFALAAYLSQTAVDVGSGTTGCVNSFAHLGFVRVGDYGS